MAPYLTTGKHNHVLKVMGESIARRLGRTLVAPIVTIEPGRPRGGLHAGGHPVLPGDVPGGLEGHGHEPEGSGLHGHLPSGGQRGGICGGCRPWPMNCQPRGPGEDVVIAHIPEYYNYGDVLTFQRDVLGIDEDPRLEGLHDDYYITSIIMHDDPEFVRLDERIRAGLTSINDISILPVEKTLQHGRRIIEFRTDVTVKAIEAAMAAGGH